MRHSIIVGIPTIGRASVLRETLCELRGQTRTPDRVVVCAARPGDAEGAADAYPGAEVLLCAQPGLPRQRNAILAASGDADLVVFFDDDFLPHPDYLAAVERHKGAARLAPFGTVVRLGAAVGVHLGVKLGRGSGLRLGYSQVANPLYLAAKGKGYPFTRAITHIARNVAMNVARSPWPEPYIDRRGRLRGNALALRDLLRGRMDPERVLTL